MFDIDDTLINYSHEPIIDIINLLNYSKELGLESNVFFLGYVPSNQLLSYYHKADFFLLFSYFTDCPSNNFRII